MANIIWEVTFTNRSIWRRAEMQVEGFRLSRANNSGKQENDCQFRRIANHNA